MSSSARATAAADPVAAVRIYREVLTAWRGAVLAEFADAPWAGPEATRLEELRLSAREELVDLELTAGRHAADLAGMPSADLADLVQSLTDQMHTAAAELQFELAARLRDEVTEMKKELRQMREVGLS